MTWTEQEREQARRNLLGEFIRVIEDSPAGITDEEVKQCFKEACEIAL